MARFINPNFHVILIHYPLALLTLGLLIEIFSFLWRRSSLRTAGRWMILIGTLAMLPAATSGIFALRDVAAPWSGDNNLTWLQTKQEANLSPEQWAFARRHIVLNAIAAGIALLAVVTWIGCSDAWRRKFYYPAILMLIVAVGFTTAGAWHGGEMVFRYGMGINGRQDVIAASEVPDKHVLDKEWIDKYCSPWQMHLIMAGLVFAVAAGALGLTIRASVLEHALLVQQKPLDEAAADLAASATLSRSQPRPISVEQTPGDETMATIVSLIPPRAPSARFWVLAAVVAVLTIVGGFWIGDYLAPPSGFGARLHKELAHVFSSAGADHRRQGLHIIFGSSILVLTIVLAIIARWAPRGRALLATFSALLILVMAVQVWLGILMLYDTGSGPVSGFQKTIPVRVHPATMGDVA